MLYKQLEDKSWLVAEKEVLTPKETITKDNQVDGWEWYDDEPKEYTQWVANIENNLPLKINI